MSCFGTGQPTASAFEQIVDHIRSLGFQRIVWTNMRQEPVVYLNGLSFTPRDPSHLSENMDFGNVGGEHMQLLTADFVQALQARASANDNNIDFFRDTFAEHPEDRVDKKHTVQLDSLLPLANVYMTLQAKCGVEIVSECLPIVDEKAPGIIMYIWNVINLLHELCIVPSGTERRITSLSLDKHHIHLQYTSFLQAFRDLDIFVRLMQRQASTPGTAFGAYFL